MVAVYNEHDEFAAAWLRNLIGANLIAPGDVDERSIEDVVPLDYAKYGQVHLFADIGVWSYSMRRGGWPDDRPGWSCSCPCQPFSQAGEGAGFADERHLWPAAYHLIGQCGPDVVFGEQVASPDGFAWLDLVRSDMEAANYAFGALVTPAAGYGAPHIRHRTYWMAHHHGARSQGRVGVFERGNQRVAGPYGLAGGVAYGQKQRLPRVDGEPHPWAPFEPARQDFIGGVGNNASGGRGEQRAALEPWKIRHSDSPSDVPSTRPGPTNGVWQDVDWLRCRDDKWRPVEPGTFPLVNGAPNRVGLLRGYGNAIVAPQAEEFIRVAMEYAP